VDVTVDMTSVNFGHEGMNAHARRADIFDVEKFPTATYKGKVSKWNGNAPAEIDGQLTLKGVTKPVKLTINQFLCKEHPMQRREVCGADATGHFMRDEFGVEVGKPMFKMDTKILISIEALKAQ
jgi:polyisoprenoid-binding protein YceI